MYFLLGQYGALLVYKQPSQLERNLTDVAHQLCLHVVGLNPTQIGTTEELAKAKEEKETKLAEEEKEEKKPAEPFVNDLGDIEDPVDPVESFNEDENRLLLQEFLLNPDLFVGDITNRNQMEIVEFTRFKCGEKNAEPSLENISRLE